MKTAKEWLTSAEAAETKMGTADADEITFIEAIQADAIEECCTTFELRVGCLAIGPAIVRSMVREVVADLRTLKPGSP